jgi:sugar phosphate isomerase/epimerase
MPDSRLEAFFASERALRNNSTTMSSLSNVKVPLAYASCSIGCKDSHTLPKKLTAIASAGFTAIELSMPDILAFAKMHLRPQKQGDTESEDIDPKDYDYLVTAAATIKAMTDAKGLKVLILQPFANFEGWPEGSAEREDAFSRLHGWMRIMEAAGTDMLQVGSSDTPAEKIGKDRSRFVADLRELADILATKGFRCAYENWCWSTHAPNWEDVWDICYFLQISDAYRMDPPLDDKADENGMRPRARWSSAYRPLPYQGYLPCADFTRAVLQTGFRDWFSYEIFDEGPDGKGKDYDMDEFAKTAMQTQDRLLAECEKA